jgi:hydroxymethylbilane synthase
MRLGLAERIRLRFDAGADAACRGQGALGIEVRAGDTALREALAG